MEWYYVQAGQRVGPISEEELDRLFQSGAINVNTLVWRAGMADWQPYSAFKGAAGPSAVLPSAASFLCSECGNSFSAENLIQIGSHRVCGNCKSIVLQRIKEGASSLGVLHYAGFGIRLLAKLVDGCIGGVLFLALTVGSAEISRRMQETAVALSVQLGLYLIFGIYSIFFVGTYGATPGKMVCRIKIINANGSKVSYAKATGRYFAELLSGLILYIGYIIAAFDEEKRALHDRICDTRVVKT
jgi:uncharacterized RDD family membrane protein YckC/DNA-directed RNA polymerase subunit RPC12/RpoP